MQNQAVDEAGNVWELDEAGNPVALAAPAPKAGRVFTLPPNPKDVRQEARQGEADARANAAEARAKEAAARTEREWNATHNPDGSPKKNATAGGKVMPDGVAKRYEDAVNAFANYDRAVSGFQDDYAGNTVTGGLENTAQSLLGTGTPGQAQWWSDFKTTDNMIRNALFGASLTAGEKQAYQETTVSPNMDPEQIKINLQRRLDLARGILSRKTNFLKANGYSEDAVDALAGEYKDALAAHPDQKADNELPTDNGADTKPPTDMRDEPGKTVADGNTSDEYSARLSSQVDSLINAGASKATIDAVLKKNNFPSIRAADLVAAKRWMQENPGKQYYGSSITKPVPLSMLAKAAASPLGSGLARYANAATAGTVGALAGEKGQGALDAMAAANPRASILGDLVGGVTGALGAEAGIAAKAPSFLAGYAPRIADAAYGGFSGFNQAEEGEGLQGAALGAGAGLAGGLIGDKAMRAVGSVARGVRDPAVQLLRDANIPLTVGQITGRTGLVGRTIKGVEDRLTGFPLTGDAVNARRGEGVEAFADRMANDAVAPIGGSSPGGYGEAVANDLKQQGSDAYTRAVAGADVPLDPQFATDMADVRALGSILPDDLAARFGKAIDNRVAPIEAEGHMTGDTFQQGMRGLKSYRAEATKPGFEEDYRNALSSGMDALRGPMIRGGGQEVVDNLNAADQAWKQIKIFEKATQAAKNGARSGEVGLPMPSQFNDAATAAANKYGGPRFNGELIDAGQAILPSKIADSGTAGRLGVGLLLGGAAAGGAGGGAMDGGMGAVGGAGAGGLGTMLLLAAGGSKPAQRIAAKMLADRPDLAVRVGDSFLRNSRIGGWTGAGVLTPLTVGN